MLFTIMAAGAFAGLSSADTITFGGTITQSTQDGTGPAVMNPSLNGIADGDPFTVTILTFAGSINAPGQYALNPAGLTFSDSFPFPNGIETNFGATMCGAQTSLACLTITADGSFDDLSLLACLATSCTDGELTANFQIPAAGLNSQNVAATGLDPPHPLDLLEDESTTGLDIQGDISTYSYTRAGTSPGGGSGGNVVPEPSFVAPMFLLFASTIFARRLSRKKGEEQA